MIGRIIDKVLEVLEEIKIRRKINGLRKEDPGFYETFLEGFREYGATRIIGEYNHDPSMYAHIENERELRIWEKIASRGKQGPVHREIFSIVPRYEKFEVIKRDYLDNTG